MKKTYKLFILAACLMFAGCAAETVIEDDKVVEKASSGHAVSQEQALKELAGVLAAIDEPRTRSGKSPRTVQNVSAVSRSALRGSATRTGGAPEGSDEPLIYIADFGEGEGSAVLAAVDYLEPVIAIFDTYLITEESLNAEPVNNYNGLTLEDIYDPVDDDYMMGAGPGGAQMPEMLIGDYINLPPDDPDPDGKLPTEDPMRPNRWRPGAWNTKIMLPMLETMWHQRAPFNNDIPGHYRVGCVTTAVAQIMAYNEFPKNYCDWSLAKLYSNSKEGYNRQSEVDAQLASLCAKIAYGCDAQFNFWWSGQTFAWPKNAEKYLRRLGYPGVGRTKYYKEDLIIKALLNDCPVFIGATSSSVFAAHAWVIDGYVYQNRTIRIYHDDILLGDYVELRFFMHCNWGWGGDRNGYFASKVFDSINGHRGENEFKETRGGNGRYNNHFRIITYDKPR